MAQAGRGTEVAGGAQALGRCGDVQGDRGPDPDEMKAGLEFVGRLVRRLLDEPAGSQ